MKTGIAYGFALFALTLATHAGAGGDTSADLAQELTNPVANLVTIPIQMNFDGDIGPADDGTKITTNVQPVIPFDIDENWNLITRTIVPVIYQDDIFPGAGSQFGLGDINLSLFLSPKQPTASGLVWGAGPVVLLPTATDSLLGAKKWGAGPAAVGLVLRGPWTVGMLANHTWSFAGDKTVEVVKAAAGRGTVVRAVGNLLDRRVVILAECRRGVAVVAEHLGDGRRRLGDDAGVAVPVVGELGNLSESDPVVVPARHQGRAGRRAHGRRVKGVVRDPLVGQPGQGRRLDLAAEGARLAKPRIVEHDDQDVGRVFGKVPGLLAPLVHRLLHGRPDLAPHGRRREWQDLLGGSGAGKQQEERDHGSP